MGKKKEGMELYGKEKNKKIEDMERKERIGQSIGRWRKERKGQMLYGKKERESQWEGDWRNGRERK